MRLSSKTPWAERSEWLPNGCYEWLGARSRKRSGIYGAARYEGRVQPAHVVAFKKYRGPVPPGWHVHHVCEFTLCVNPAHLQAIPSEVNEELGRRSKDDPREWDE